MSISDFVHTPRTLAEILHNRAELHGEQCAFTYLLDRDGAESPLTYSELDRNVRAIAARLQQSAAADSSTRRIPHEVIEIHR